MATITLDQSVVLILREALREKGARQILTDDEYDALLHVNAVLNKQVSR